jgi:nucleotide-binding universal stress UspA family protein
MDVTTMNETHTRTTPAGAFGRVLVVVDASREGHDAAAYADEMTRQLGGVVHTVAVTEEFARNRSGTLSRLDASGDKAIACTVSGPSEGARSRTLAAHLARTAQDVGADVIVLGLSRRRLTHHRLTPSLRSLIARASDVPVLLVPVGWDQTAGTDGRDDALPSTHALDTERAAAAARAKRFAGV